MLICHAEPNTDAGCVFKKSYFNFKFLRPKKVVDLLPYMYLCQY